MVKLLTDADYPIIAQRRLPNNLGWQLRLATGQVVTVYDTGSLLVQGVDREPVQRLLKRLTGANPMQGQGNSAPARDKSNLPPPDKRASRSPAPPAPQVSYIDANGYPIRLPGTDALLAMAPPRPPPKVWQNPKTLRHMENRLRALGYSIRSEKILGGEWRIKLETGQTICYREGGQVSLAPFQRDYRLERLFKMDD